jgi:alpha-1,2-mannosyltransferase
MAMSDRDEVAAPAARPRQRRGWWIVLAGTLIFAAALGAYTWMAVLYPVRFWKMNDLVIYRLAGIVARQDGPLYTATFLRSALRFTYPPASAMLFAALSNLSIAVLKVVMTVASLLALLFSAWLAWGAAGVRAPVARAGAALAVAGLTLWTDPVQASLGFGQINLVLMIIALADLCQRDSRWWKGAGVGIAAGLKLTPAIFIIYLLVTRRFRAAIVAIAAFGATIGAGFIMLPTQSHKYWLGGLFFDSSRTGGNDYVANQSLYGVIVRLTHNPAAAHPYWIATAIGIGICGLAVAAWAHRRGQELTAIVTCAVTGLLISPVSWDHHWVWIDPMLVAVLAPAWRYRSKLAWAGGFVLLAPFFQYPVPPAHGGPVFPIGLIWTVPNAGNLEYTWTGLQVVTGNLYAICGLVILCTVAITLALTRKHSRGAGELGSGGLEPAGLEPGGQESAAVPHPLGTEVSPDPAR